MKKLILMCLLVAFAISGCKTTLKINNKTDPQSFEPFVLGTSTTHYYKELSVDVPEEIRNDDFDVTRVDIYADVYTLNIVYPVHVRIYVGLEPGEDNIDDPKKNQLIADDTVGVNVEYHRFEIHSPKLIFKALKQETFYMKAVLTSAGPTGGMVEIKNVYLNIWLERETSGLIPFFYFF